MTLGEQIAKRRKKEGLSQEELGEKLGVTRQAVSKWESGQAAPELEKLKELGRIFSVSLDELLGDDVEQPREPDPQPADPRPDPMPTPVLISPPQPKGKKWPYTAAAAGILAAFAIITAVMHSRITRLDERLRMMQGELSAVRGEFSATVSSLKGSIEQSLEEQASIISDFSYEVLDFLPAKKRMLVRFYVSPKTSTEQTAAQFSFTGEDFEPFLADARGEGGVFTAQVELPLSHQITVSANFSADGVQTTEKLDTIYGFDGHLLDISTGFEGDLTRTGFPGVGGSTVVMKGAMVVRVEMNKSAVVHSALMNHPESGTVHLYLDGERYRSFPLVFDKDLPQVQQTDDAGMALWTGAATHAEMDEEWKGGQWEEIRVEVEVVDRFGIRYRQTPYLFREGEEAVLRDMSVDVVYPENG